MSCRLQARLGLAALALAALAACNDSSTQPKQIDSGPPPNLSVSTSCNVTEIYQLVTWLTPLRNAPLDLRGPTTVALTFSNTRQALAQQMVMRFAEALTPAVIAKLNTPPNPPYASKQAAVSVLIADLMQCAGIAPTQAPPPEAYLPTGGLKVIDNNGGTLYAGDKQSVMDVPAGAVTGPHLFSIAVLPPAVRGARCLPPGREDVIEVGQCYDFAVTPDVGSKTVEGGGFVGEGVFAAACSPGHDGEEVHSYLELAKTDHLSPNTFTVYPRVQRASITVPMTCGLGDGPLTPTASIMGGAWSKVRFALSALASPFAPKVANAADGVGSLFADLTHASLVYRKRPLTVSPASATILTGGSQAFAAAPTDGGDARGGTYVWSINGTDIGSAGFSPAYGTLEVATNGRSATYAAPALVPELGTFDVCVRRAAAPADHGCVSLTIVGSFVGSWSGTIHYQDLTPQPVSMTISSQQGTTASGDLFVYFPGASLPYNTSSAFTGVVTGNNLSFTIPLFVDQVGAAVNVTKSGDALDGTMAEVLGRTFTAHFDRVVIIGAKVPAFTPMLSRSMSTTPSTSTAPTDGAFGRRAP